MRRGILNLVVAVSLLFSGAAAVTSTPKPGVLDAPGTAEAANLPEVPMVCAPGQTDINGAGLDSLTAALGVSEPIARRIAGYRPYLQPRDLSVVEGIGPGRLAILLRSGALCATPTSSPPPAREACTSSLQVDLQAAPPAELVNRLGISLPTALRLALARPFASMRHVSPERVPGVGKGTLDSIIRASCLTPSPIRTATTSWRWAYASQNTTVQRDGFSLRVPPTF